MVFLALTVIALFNAAQLREQHNTSVRLLNWELTQVLQLDKNQMEKIHIINAVYEVEVARLRHEDVAMKQEKVNQLLCERNKRILQVLDRDQQNMLYRYCSDVISFSKMFQ